ncbi:MAG: hypothetical protein J4400_00715 [Candidatus Aenigmarchaeota archaeon]|nr:hypothetical protein [Candidatus Aenigmarchaeota archaeon]
MRAWRCRSWKGFQSKLVLRSMESEGMIEIVRKHGIRLKKEQKCYGYNGVR